LVVTCSSPITRAVNESPDRSADQPPDMPESQPEQTRDISAASAALSANSDPTVDGVDLSALGIPLIGAGVVAGLVGLVLGFTVDTGDLGFYARPGLLLSLTAVFMITAGVLYRLKSFGLVRIVTAIGAAGMLALGAVLVFRAIIIELSGASATNAGTQALALLVVAPICTIPAFALLPPLKLLDQRADGTPESWVGMAAAALKGLAIIFTIFGLLCAVLGLADWARGVSPTEDPYLFFAGCFAVLVGLLNFGLGRFVEGDPPAANDGDHWPEPIEV